MKTKIKNRNRKQLRAIVGTSLASASLFQLAFPFIANAEGIKAGTTISNTATATYDDGKGTTVEATSNTVQVTVAEVAGITNTPVGVVDPNGGSYEVNDYLDFKFKITNTGNSTTHFAIPNAATLKADGALTGVDQDDVTITAVKSDGTTAMTLSPYNTNYLVTDDTIAPDDYITVTVKVKVTATVAGNDIAVRFGDIAPNDNTSGTQNQAFSADTQKNDVYTVDAPDAVGSAPFDVADDSAGAPINGEREAAAYQKVALATQAKKLALAKVKKTGAISSTGASIGGNDDEITFNLNLEVLGTSPDATFTPEDLAGTPIRLDSADATRILVSDVVPEGTVLKEAPIAPAGGNWKVVYSTSDPTTTIPVKSSAAGALAAAEWTTTEPTSPAGFAAVKRVGFIYEPGGTGSDTAKITKGSPLISGFSFKVVTSGLQPIGGNVYNMGQVFGTTNGGNGEIVYDESGDNNANNFNDNGTPPDDTGTNFDPANNNGIPDPDLNNDGTEDNVDTAGNNTGTGTEGEVLKIVVVGTVLATDDILNGPAGQAGAVGPNNDNDDYTNATTAVPAGFQEGTNITTAQTQTITNTVGVKTGVPRIDNITLEPIAPSLAAAKGGGNYYGANTDIPDETLVTITYGAKTATYIYDQTNGEFDLQSGTPVNIGTLLGGQTANYTVQITIPANTVDPLTAVSVPIIAFPDDGNRETDNTDSTAVDSKGADGIAGTADDPTGVAYTGESVNNITIDRLYTGFMKLVKEARILNTDGTVKSGWTTNPTAKAAPGEFIEYRITYTNISQTPQGTGNVSLTAKNFSLIEDGNAAFSGVKTAGPDGIPGNGDDVTIADGSGDDNNWAANTTHQQSTVVGGIGSSTTVDYYKGASKIGSSDPSNGTAVDKYINTVPSISPGISGTFKFRRMVNLGPTP